MVHSATAIDRARHIRVPSSEPPLCDPVCRPSTWIRYSRGGLSGETTRSAAPNAAVTPVCGRLEHGIPLGLLAIRPRRLSRGLAQKSAIAQRPLPVGTAPHEHATSHLRVGKGRPSPGWGPLVRVPSYVSEESRAPLVAPVLRFVQVSELRRIRILNADELTRPICSSANPQAVNSDIAMSRVLLLAARGLHGKTHQKCDLHGSLSLCALPGT